MKTLEQVLDWHLKSYPLIQAADIYKLLHQGVFGPGHIVKSMEQARAALEQEFARIKHRPCTQETARLEPLDPEEKLARVNLEPLRDKPAILEQLVSVLIQSSRTVSGSPELMRERLAQAVDWCCRNLPEQTSRLAEITKPAEAEGFPALHHSKVYQAAYRPAYRVVRLDLWKEVESGPGGPPRPYDTTA